MAVWRLPKTKPRLSLLEQVKASRSFAAEDAIQPDPFSVPGMKDAVPLVLRAALKKSSIAIFGDYDCDGICGTAILDETLRVLGMNPLVRLPRRDEGNLTDRVHAGNGCASHCGKDSICWEL